MLAWCASSCVSIDGFTFYTCLGEEREKFFYRIFLPIDLFFLSPALFPSLPTCPVYWSYHRALSWNKTLFFAKQILPPVIIAKGRHSLWHVFKLISHLPSEREEREGMIISEISIMKKQTLFYLVFAFLYFPKLSPQYLHDLHDLLTIISFVRHLLLFRQWQNNNYHYNHNYLLLWCWWQIPHLVLLFVKVNDL